MECSCCGAQDEPVVALMSRDDVGLCRSCIDWLASRSGVTSTPTLPVHDLPEAVAFYERAGFGVRLYQNPDGTPGGFAFVDHQGRSVFDLGVEDVDPNTNRAGCYLVVHDADAWHAHLTEAGLQVTDIAEQPWGMREFGFRDPAGNRLRIGCNIGDG